MVFACLDCGGLHHLDHLLNRAYIRAIDREGTNLLKERYVVEEEMADKGSVAEVLLFGPKADEGE